MSEYPYRYGLKLATDTYTDLTSGEHLVKANRTFAIFKWESAVEFEKTVAKLKKNESGVPVVVRDTVSIPDTGMWLPILRFTGGKWRKITEEQKYYLQKKINYKDVMTPMHMFFKDDKEFKEWLTTPLYNSLIIDLI